MPSGLFSPSIAFKLQLRCLLNRVCELKSCCNGFPSAFHFIQLENLNLRDGVFIVAVLFPTSLCPLDALLSRPRA